MGAVDAQSYEVSDEEPSEESDHESSDEKPIHLALQELFRMN